MITSKNKPFVQWLLSANKDVTIRTLSIIANKATNETVAQLLENAFSAGTVEGIKQERQMLQDCGVLVTTKS